MYSLHNMVKDGKCLRYKVIWSKMVNVYGMDKQKREEPRKRSTNFVILILHSLVLKDVSEVSSC